MIFTFGKQRNYICAIFLFAILLLGLDTERVDASSTKLWLPARAGTASANASTKRDIENSFPGTQMFVQARNYECPQKTEHFIFHVFKFDNK